MGKNELKEMNESLLIQLKTAQETIEYLRNEIKNMSEKEIPKKPLVHFSTHAIYDGDGNYLDQLDITTFKCPTCNHILASGEISITDCYETHYCDNCGKAIDWSE